MTLSNTIRALLHKWYVALPGIALSCALASMVFILVPAHYTSTGLAMVVAPKRPGTLKSQNPLLSFETSLNTTAVMLGQSLNTPQSAASLGADSGPDKYTVKNVGDTSTGGDPNQPFIYVTAQGSTPQASADLVESVLNLASQQLADQQRSMHVANQDALTLVIIADASTPKLAPGLSLAATVGVLCVGLGLTILACMASDRGARTRRQFRQMAAHRFAPDPLAPLTLEYGEAHLTRDSHNTPKPRIVRR